MDKLKKEIRDYLLLKARAVDYWGYYKRYYPEQHAELQAQFQLVANPVWDRCIETAFHEAWEKQMRWERRLEAKYPGQAFCDAINASPALHRKYLTPAYLENYYLEDYIPEYLHKIIGGQDYTIPMMHSRGAAAQVRARFLARIAELIRAEEEKAA